MPCPVTPSRENQNLVSLERPTITGLPKAAVTAALVGEMGMHALPMSARRSALEDIWPGLGPKAPHA